MKYLLFSTFFLFINSINSQKYWQQKVDYTISVELDDVNHYLNANETFVYTNNSPNDLNEIYIHLWPNAYKNKETALAEQQYKSGEKILFYGDPSAKGWIDSLDFTSNGVDLEWNFDSEHQDIAIIKLKTPLKSGNNIEISTPFRVKIPSGEFQDWGISVNHIKLPNGIRNLQFMIKMDGNQCLILIKGNFILNLVLLTFL